MIRLAPGQFVDLLALSDDFDDPFGLLALADAQGVQTDDAQFLEDAQDALSDILEGHDDRFRAAIADLLERRPTQLLDRITAELAAAACCDPATACAIAIVLDDDANIQDSATDQIVLYVDDSDPPDSASTLTRVWVADGTLWDALGRLIVTLPETALSAAIGRRLRDVVSHPVLDRFDLTITGSDSSGAMRFLLVDADRAPLTSAQIMAIRPVTARHEGGPA